MPKKVLAIFIRAVIGGIFIFSAYAKLYPVEIFEMKFVEAGAGWSAAPFIARLFISAEFILGLFLIFNIDFKITIRAIIGVLVCFTFYLSYILIFHPQEEDCGCFGLMLEMSPAVSLVKNGMLLGLAFILIPINEKWNYPRWMKWARLSSVIAALALPHILNPVFAEAPNPYKTDMVGERLATGMLKEFKNEKGDTVDLQSGKKIICFFSMNCQFCKLAAKKISIMQGRLDKEALPFYFVFFGEEAELQPFMATAGTENVPAQVVTPDIFFKLSGSELPVIYFLRDGIVMQRCGFLDFSQDKVEDFLRK